MTGSQGGELWNSRSSNASTSSRPASTLEGLLDVRPEPLPRPEPIPRPRVEPPAPVVPPRAARPDLEELLGGRVLGWVGGVAVAIAAVLVAVAFASNLGG